MENDAKNKLKLEVIVKTDDGKVICQKKIEPNKSSSHMDMDQNSSHSINNNHNGILPKGQSRFSKFLNWFRWKSPKKLPNVEPSSSPQHRATFDLNKKNSIASPSISGSSNSKSLSIVTKESAGVHLNGSFSNALTASSPLDESGDKSSTNLEATPSNVGPETESLKKEMQSGSSNRYEGKGHWPLFDKKSGESSCHMENCRNRTHVYCEKCDLHFCFNAFRNCFYKFHKRNGHAAMKKSEPLTSKVQRAPKNDPALRKPTTVKCIGKNLSISNVNDKQTSHINRKNSVTNVIERRKKARNSELKTNIDSISKYTKSKS